MSELHEQEALVLLERIATAMEKLERHVSEALARLTPVKIDEPSPGEDEP